MEKKEHKKMSQNGGKEFYCKICDQYCKSKFNLNRHFSTTTHKMKQNETNVSPSEPMKFSCKLCDYNTSKKSNFNRHLLTPRHKMKQFEQIMKQMEKKGETHKSTLKLYCNNCNKKFNSRTTLWRHKKKCDFIKEEEEGQKEENALVDAFIKIVEVQKTTTEALSKLSKQSIITNSQITNNNNNMTINMYLNKECTNAMNLNDFVNKVKVSIEDLIYTKQNGYVEGISNIFIKNLTDMNPKERPIHCSDKKKRQFYIKDKDEWNQDKNNKKINKTISFIEKKQILKIKEWEKLHPKYLEDDDLTEEWQNMFRTAFHDAEKKDLDNIHKNVSEAVIIDEITKD
jgi:hypothetical protein